MISNGTGRKLLKVLQDLLDGRSGDLVDARFVAHEILGGRLELFIDSAVLGERRRRRSPSAECRPKVGARSFRAGLITRFPCQGKELVATERAEDSDGMIVGHTEGDQGTGISRALCCLRPSTSSSSEAIRSWWKPMPVGGSDSTTATTGRPERKSFRTHEEVFATADMIVKVKEPTGIGVRSAARRPDSLHLSPSRREQGAHAVSASRRAQRASLTRRSKY